VLLIFGHAGLEVGQFPDLVAERLRIGAGQSPTAAPAGGRHTPDDLLALFGRQQGTPVLLVAGLAAGSAASFGLGPWRFGVRVRGRGRQRRIGRVLTEFGFQFGHALR
jgi:hypothetical protein